MLFAFYRFLHVCTEFSEETLPPAVLYGVYQSFICQPELNCPFHSQLCAYHVLGLWILSSPML